MPGHTPPRMSGASKVVSPLRLIAWCNLRDKKEQYNMFLPLL